MPVSRAQSIQIAANFISAACPDYGAMESIAFALGDAASAATDKKVKKILGQLSMHLHEKHDAEVK